MTPRTRGLLVAGLIALCLIAGAPPRSVGDGGEYIVQAMNFASGHGPSLGRRDIPLLHRQITAWEPGYANWDIEKATWVASDRRRDFVHFWFYALLAAPFMWLTMAVGAAPTYAFAALNVVLLGMALWVALPRVGPAAAVLLFFSPLIWFLDKPHTEVFTVAWLTTAFALMRERPAVALVAAGMAATQNPPIAAVVMAMLAAIAITDARARRDRAVWAGALVAIGLTLLQPVYTYVRYGTPSLLLSATRPGLPTFAEWSAVVIDPTIGLVGNYPALPVAAVLAAAVLARRDPRRALAPDLLVALVAAGVFLFSFARTANVRHGGTPSLSRYALWFIPLMIPLLAHAASVGGSWWRRTVAVLAGVSALVCLFAFHPRVYQNARQPTWLAAWQWAEHPAWHNPLPEVFAETLRNNEEIAVPTATAGCEKVLLTGEQQSLHGAWPLPCYPAEVPAACQQAGVLCYANREGRRYTFTPAPGRRGEPGLVLAPERWAPAMEPHVRALFDTWGWPGLDLPRHNLEVLRQAVDVVVWPFGSEDRFLAVLPRIGPGAALRFRMPSPAQGVVIDPATGGVLQQLEWPGSADEIWSIVLPQGHDVLLLTMTIGGQR